MASGNRRRVRFVCQILKLKSSSRHSSLLFRVGDAAMRANSVNNIILYIINDVDKSRVK